MTPGTIKAKNPKDPAHDDRRRPPDAPATAAPLEGELQQRKWRRRNDISTLHGLIREHSRLIGAIQNGRIDLSKGEVLSRAYGRHREMVHAREEVQNLEVLAERLKTIIEARSSPLKLTAQPQGIAASQEHGA